MNAGNTLIKRDFINNGQINIFGEKLEPYEEEYQDFLANTDNPWRWILKPGDRAVYVGYFSLE